MTLRPIFFVGLACTALAACATPMGPAAADRFDNFDVVSTADFTRYERVHLAPITVSEEMQARIGYRTLGPQDRVRPLAQRDLDAQLAELREDLEQAIDIATDLVAEPGPGILSVSVEVTRLEANRPTQAELADRPGLSLDSRYSGGASATVTFSEDGRVLATARDSNVGDELLQDVSPAVWGEATAFYRRLGSKIASLLG